MYVSGAKEKEMMVTSPLTVAGAASALTALIRAELGKPYTAEFAA